MVEQLVFNVGMKLEKLREELGLSLRQLSEKVGVSPSTIQKIENNQISPTLETILKIARGLRKDIQRTGIRTLSSLIRPPGACV